MITNPVRPCRTFPRQIRNLALSIACAAALISLSCSRQTKTAEGEAKEPAAESAPSMPAGAMALSAVLKSVESAGYGPIVEVELEKDHWEIKAYSNQQLLQLKADPVTGALIPSPPPKIDKPLSEVVKSVEDQGYGPIADIEHAEKGESAAWKIEAYRGKSEVKITVEPDGKITVK